MLVPSGLVVNSDSIVVLTVYLTLLVGGLLLMSLLKNSLFPPLTNPVSTECLLEMVRLV